MTHTLRTIVRQDGTLAYEMLDGLGNVVARSRHFAAVWTKYQAIRAGSSK